MRVAMIGTRGVPARYGGFETAIEEIGRRLVARGHEVVVYCRGAEDPSQRTHLGMELVHLPAARRKTLETLSHTALSVAHLVGQRRCRRRDRLQRRQRAVRAAAAGSRHPGRRPRRRTGVEALEVEGRRPPLLPRGRGHVGAAGRCPDRRRPRHRRLLRRRVRRRDRAARLRRTGPGRARVRARRGARPPSPASTTWSWLASSRRTTCREIVEGYHRSDAELPLVVVGSAPYADDYTARDRDGRRGRPADPAARRRLGPGAARRALRQRAHLPARPLGRRDQPVAAAGHGRAARR